MTDWRDRHKKQPPFLKVRGFLVKNFRLYLKSIPFKTKISFIILLWPFDRPKNRKGWTI